MALPNGLPQISDVGSLLSTLGNDITSIPLMTATSTSGTPAAGYFHSSIQNRAQMYDLRNDLSINMGINRICVQQIYQIQNEFGPNGEPVWGAVNDTYGQIRFVGGTFYNKVDTNGPVPRADASNNLNHYVEITFYGTGLNWLTMLATSSDFRASVDGGAEGSSLLPASMSTTQAGRNTSQNIIIPIAKNLTLGVHTVKIRANNTLASFGTYGFEVLNESSSLKVNPGTTWKNGQKLYNPSQNISSYNSGFESGTLGTRGGRVVVYQKADGSIAKAVNPTNNSAAYSTSADHSNEEIARSYFWREFGANRNPITAGQAFDDFSSDYSSIGNRYFTLDDGVTTLVANQCLGGDTNGVEMRTLGTSRIEFTFVGTGLDVIRNDDAATVNTTQIWVDGVLQGTLPTSGYLQANALQKVVSGLPYGTHTVQFFQPAAGFLGRTRFSRFIVYQPKTPSIPSGAAQIGAYNIMANYSATSTISSNANSAGIVKHNPNREVVFGPNWSSVFAIDEPLGTQLTTVTNGAYFEFSFIGTAFDICGRSGSGTNTMQLYIDDVLYTGAATVVGTGSWTPGTSTYLVGNTIGGQKLQVSGLSYGYHKIKLQKNNGVDGFNLSSIDTASLIHSHKNNGPFVVQNTLRVGSQGIQDNRLLASQVNSKNISQALGVGNDPTTSSSSAIPMPDMSVTHISKTGKVRVSFSAIMSGTVAEQQTQMMMNGSSISTIKQNRDTTGSPIGNTTDTKIVACNIGDSNKFDVYWSSGGATPGLTASYNGRNLTVEDIN